VIVCSDLSGPLHSLSDVLKLVINMQHIASHPQLVEPSDILSPFHMVDTIDYHTARLLDSISDGSQRDVSLLMTVHLFTFLLMLTAGCVTLLEILEIYRNYFSS